ncbi:MAG: DUF2306 domain-containing protein [Chloroflexi bacterium]|nr:DUF2306 domain-containing protein [Chloroflexota bacterium]
MSTLGWVHMIFGLVALVAGTAVLSISKGTRWHRMLGHVYLISMIALNVTALFIYDLFGSFGAFHWMALASLITLILGMVPVFTRRPKGRWLELHGGFISGSYVGLVAATASEVTSRLPGGWESFSGSVTAVTTIVITVVGMMLISRNLQKSVKRTPSRFQKVR